VNQNDEKNERGICSMCKFVIGGEEEIYHCGKITIDDQEMTERKLL
jgi:hypothetical protein